MTATPFPFYVKNAEADPQTITRIAPVRAFLWIGYLQWPGRLSRALRAHAHGLGAPKPLADRVAR